MTGYELSKDWFDWAFENPDLNSPTTTALYMWVIEKWNRMSQKPKFGFPASEAMEAIGVKSYNTYKKSLSQLVELGAIVMVQESKNQYTANIIAVSKFNKAHTKALSKHLLKQSESTSESSSSIDKPRTSNLEPKNIPPPPVGAEIDFMGLQDQVQRWLKYKKDKGKTYRNNDSIQIMIKKLHRFSQGNPNTATQIIEDAMSNNYDGFFQPKEIITPQIPPEQRQVTPDLPNHKRGVEYRRSGIENRTFKGNYNEFLDAKGCTPDETFTIVREYVIG
jgi:hypothetical protein